MESQQCPQCLVVLHGSAKWIAKMLAKPCKDHAGRNGELWQ